VYLFNLTVEKVKLAVYFVNRHKDKVAEGK